MTYRRIEIEWYDSWANDAPWVDAAAARDVKLARCSSIGYLIAETSDAIRIAQSVGAEGENLEEFGNTLTVPRVCLIGEPRDL